MVSPSRHSEGYQAAYGAARSRSAAWVREHLPAVWAAARGDTVDEVQVRAELRKLAESDELEMP